MIRLPFTDNVVDLTTGKITRIWQRAFEAIAEAAGLGSEGTVWSTVAGTAAWRSVNELFAAGSIRQVVYGSTTAPVASSSNVYAATGLSAAITLNDADHKVRVRVHQNGCLKDTGNTSIGLRLLRGVTVIATFAASAGDTNSVARNAIGTISGEYLDTPGDVGPHTYTTQFASVANVATVSVQAGNETSSIALEEIVT